MRDRANGKRGERIRSSPPYTHPAASLLERAEDGLTSGLKKFSASLAAEIHSPLLRLIVSV